MPNLKKRVALRLASVPRPRILVDDNLRFLPALVIDVDTTGQSAPGSNVALRSSISPDFFRPLRHAPSQSALSAAFESPQAMVSADVLPDLAGFPSSSVRLPVDLDLTARFFEPEQVTLRVSVALAAVALEAPNLPFNRFRTLTTPKVMGMNYRDRYWRQLPLDGSEDLSARQPGTKPLRKSYQQITEVGDLHRRTTEPRPPTFWDQVFPVLLPPLVIKRLQSEYLPHKLYKFQPAGIDFLMHNESALLADEMGTGKTVMTTVALRILVQKGRIKSALIVSPVSVLREWNQHLEDWAPELLVTFVRGPRSDRSYDWKTPAHVYVTTYDTLRSDVNSGTLPRKKLSAFDVVVLDEAQAIKNPESGRSKAIRKINAPQRWALTGTPVENKIEDLVSIFDFLRPGYLTDSDLRPTRIRRKIAPYFLRRRKKDVLKDLPPKVKQECWLELSEDQRRVYEEVASRGRDELQRLGDRLTKVHIFGVLQKLKQICNFHPKESQSPKLDYLKEQLEDIIESGQKVIVFSQYLGEGVDKLENGLGAYGIAKIVGGQTDAVRAREIARFKKQEACPILLASVQAGGVGLNLTEASYVVHFDHWWNPAVMWQAEDRVHRPGQTRGVNVYSYWMADTIEERIYRTLEKKARLFGDVVEELSEGKIYELISVDEWLEMLDVKRPKAAKLGSVVAPPGEAIEPTEVVERLRELAPDQFEILVKKLMESLTYPNVKVTGKSSDGGIDVMSTRNTDDGIVRAIAQCKRIKGTVGVKVARELKGVMGTDDSIKEAYLVTTGKFSPQCLKFCIENGIETIDGPRLAMHVLQYGLSV